MISYQYFGVKISPREIEICLIEISLVYSPGWLAVIDVYVGVMMLAGLLITMMTLFIMVIITINTYILILSTEHYRIQGVSPPMIICLFNDKYRFNRKYFSMQGKV